MHDHHSYGYSATIDLPSGTEGLPEARRPEIVELADGDEFDIAIAPVQKLIGEATVRMLAYNGSIPGPTLKVPQGSTIIVHVTNHGDIGDRPLARHSHREPIRRDARDADPGPGRRDLHLPGDLSRSRRLLVPPAHP
jgi:hypothetical protein